MAYWDTYYPNRGYIEHVAIRKNFYIFSIKFHDIHVYSSLSLVSFYNVCQIGSRYKEYFKPEYYKIWYWNAYRCNKVFRVYIEII